MLVRMTIEGVYFDAESKSPVVILKEPEGERRVPIWIGAFEAMAILISLEGTQVPRPITHDLAAEIMRKLGARVARVEVTRLEEGVYYALVHIEESDGTLIEVDSRPSDALALAARFDAQILVEGAVLDAAAKAGRYKDKDPEYWKKYLESLDPEAFGKYRM